MGRPRVALLECLFRSVFLNLRTTDIGLDSSLLGEGAAILCVVGCLTASLVSTQEIRVASPSVVTTKKCLQTFPDVLQVDHHWFRVKTWRKREKEPHRDLEGSWAGTRGRGVNKSGVTPLPLVTANLYQTNIFLSMFVLKRGFGQ